jgi:acetoin utilization protein AcuB
MNQLDLVSSLMTKKLITVNPEDNLLEVKQIFEKHRIHHIPVVRYRSIVGLVSKSDFVAYEKGMKRHEEDKVFHESRLKIYKAQDIMTTGLAKVTSTDRLNVVIEIFKENLFHAIPVVDDEELVGIITTYDIIKALASEKAGFDYNQPT